MFEFLIWTVCGITVVGTKTYLQLLDKTAPGEDFYLVDDALETLEKSGILFGCRRVLFRVSYPLTLTIQGLQFVLLFTMWVQRDLVFRFWVDEKFTNFRN